MMVNVIYADQLPIKNKFKVLIDNLKPSIHIVRPIRPILPIHPIRPIIPRIKPKDIDMIDGISGNFTAPGDLAKKCILAEDNLFDKCRKDGYEKFAFLGDQGTIWTSCCAAYSELSCYQRNAKALCPQATLIPFLLYTNKFAHYLQGSVCKTMGFSIIDWKKACNEKTAELLKEEHQKKNKTSTNPKDKDDSTFSLPPDSGPEKACFTKLRKTNKDNKNFEKECMDAASSKYDPTKDKWSTTPTRDVCYQTFNTLDCLDQKSKDHCTTDERTDFLKYQTKAITILDSSLCTNATSDSYRTSLKEDTKVGKSNALSTYQINSFFALILCFFLCYF